MDIITLISRFAGDLIRAEEKFWFHTDRLDDLEQEVREISNRAAADFIGMVLTSVNEAVCNSGARKRIYNMQRHDDRTLITSVGDVTFTHTLFKNKSTGQHLHLLDEMIGLPPHERFSGQAEAKLLSEAEVHSYQHAADSLSIGEQKVSKVAVMEKVHQVTDYLSEEGSTPQKKKKCCEFLYIEADEDHIHRQKQDKKKGCMIGQLIYLFERKEDVGSGRRILISPHYFGGLYAGSNANRMLWESVQKYIEDHYDTEFLKTVYISGDGGGWIQVAADYIDKGVLVADRFHLMEYIYRVSRLTLDEKDITAGRFYKYIWKDRLLAAKKLLTRIKNHCGGDKAVEDCRTYLENNWEAIQRAYHDKNVFGSSTEAHVSHVYSERMSSRPMGWSEEGTEGMCRLRCFVRNEGRENIIHLVRYRREREMQSLRVTGTDGMIEEPVVKKRISKERRDAFAYIEKLQATIPGMTVKKTLSIREQIGNI